MSGRAGAKADNEKCAAMPSLNAIIIRWVNFKFDDLLLLIATQVDWLITLLFLA